LQCRSQGAHCLKHDISSLAQALGSWVRIPLEAWMSLRVSSMIVLSWVGCGLSVGWPPPLPKESYLLSVSLRKCKTGTNVYHELKSPQITIITGAGIFLRISFTLLDVFQAAKSAQCNPTVSIVIVSRDECSITAPSWYRGKKCDRIQSVFPLSLRGMQARVDM
jgi:hypothetical protein